MLPSQSCSGLLVTTPTVCWHQGMCRVPEVREVISAAGSNVFLIPILFVCIEQGIDLPIHATASTELRFPYLAMLLQRKSATSYKHTFKRTLIMAGLPGRSGCTEVLSAPLPTSPKMSLASEADIFSKRFQQIILYEAHHLTT